MIQRDTAMPINWPDYSQGGICLILPFSRDIHRTNSAWGAVSLGSVDPSLCGIAMSPIGLSPNGGLVPTTCS